MILEPNVKNLWKEMCLKDTPQKKNVKKLNETGHVSDRDEEFIETQFCTVEVAFMTL